VRMGVEDGVGKSDPAILSGGPSVTDSDVKKDADLRLMPCSFVSVTQSKNDVPGNGKSIRIRPWMKPT